MTATLLSVFGALGGIAVFAAAVWGLLRGLVHQADATKANTKATEALTKAMSGVNGRVDEHGTRIAILEDWRKGSQA